MPAAKDDGLEDADADGADGCRDFDAGHFDEAAQEYGILHMLFRRDDSLDKPDEMANLKTADIRLCTFPEPAPATTRGRGGGGKGPIELDEEDYISEGEPSESTSHANWPGRPCSWWRVHNLLGEELIVRSGVSLLSPEVRRVSPGEIVQQGGLARCLNNGNAKGCVRLPVRGNPNGWVTADATKAGGPRYIVRASAPRWRVVYYGSNDSKDSGSVIVRETAEFASDEVCALHFGDIVEQAAPSVVQTNGIVRMQITTAVVRRSEAEAEAADGNGHTHRSSMKTLGWVTVDASAANGPVFLKPAGDDGSKRRRRPKVS